MGGQGTFGGLPCQYINASGAGSERYRLRPLFSVLQRKKAAARLSASWSRCVGTLEHELPEQQFNTWVKPLQAIESSAGLRLLAPNRFVVDWVRTHLLARIESLLLADGGLPVSIEIGSREPTGAAAAPFSAAAPVVATEFLG